MASILKVDNLKGSSTAGEITITLENDESQILQQGIAKATANITQAGALNADSSLNITSCVDTSTGILTTTITNPFSAVKASVPNVSIHDSSYARAVNIDDTSTSVFITRTFVADSGSLTETDCDNSFALHGDLA
jgi:hypothetical protein